MRWLLPLALLAACLVIAAAWLGASGPGARHDPEPAATAERPLGLFTSLPILWRETGDIADLLRGDAAPHPALGVLSRHGRPVALDTLADASGALPLPPEGLLVMAQPRPLSPQENVALDSWVRGGGRVLLFADPLLTAHSAFAVGDRRRPQDVVLLSPILTRWGLALQFDETQPADERMAALPGEGGAQGVVIPVNLPGSFAVVAGEGACTLVAGGLLARCRIGAGRVLALADAAVLEDNGAALEARDRALSWLLSEAIRPPHGKSGNGSPQRGNSFHNSGIKHRILRTFGENPR